MTVNQSTYTRDDLTKLARERIKGRGKYRSWELQITNHGARDVVSLIIVFVCAQTGQEARASVRI